MATRGVKDSARPGWGNETEATEIDSLTVFLYIRPGLALPLTGISNGNLSPK